MDLAHRPLNDSCWGRSVSQFPSPGFPNRSVCLELPSFFPQVWFSGILGIHNNVAAVECWFWNDCLNEYWMLSRDVRPCNWKTVSNWEDDSCVFISAEKFEGEYFGWNDGGGCSYETSAKGWVTGPVSISWKRHNSALTSSTVLSRSSESVRLSDVSVLSQWSGMINSSVTWKESRTREIRADCSGRKRLMKTNTCNPPPHRADDHCSRWTWTRGPLVGSSGVSALLNATYPPVRPGSTLWVMVVSKETI